MIFDNVYIIQFSPGVLIGERVIVNTVLWIIKDIVDWVETTEYRSQIFFLRILSINLSQKAIIREISLLQ